MVLASLARLPLVWHSPSFLLKFVVFPVILVFSPTASRIKQSVHPTGLTEHT